MWRTPAYALSAVALGIVLLCHELDVEQIPLAPRVTLFGIVLALGTFQFRYFAEFRARGEPTDEAGKERRRTNLTLQIEVCWTLFAIGVLLLISCSLDVLATLSPPAARLRHLSIAFFAMSLAAFYEIGWRYAWNLRQELRA